MKYRDTGTTTLITCVVCKRGFKPWYMRWYKDGGLACKDCFKTSWINKK